MCCGTSRPTSTRKPGRLATGRACGSLTPVVASADRRRVLDRRRTDPDARQGSKGGSCRSSSTGRRWIAPWRRRVRGPVPTAGLRSRPASVGSCWSRSRCTPYTATPSRWPVSVDDSWSGPRRVGCDAQRGRLTSDTRSPTPADEGRTRRSVARWPTSSVEAHEAATRTRSARPIQVGPVPHAWPVAQSPETERRVAGAGQVPGPQADERPAEPHRAWRPSCSSTAGGMRLSVIPCGDQPSAPDR